MIGFLSLGSLAMATEGLAEDEAGKNQEQAKAPTQGEDSGRVALRVSKDLRVLCLEECDDLAKLCVIVADQCLRDLAAGKGDAKSLAQLHHAVRDGREFCTLVVTMMLRDDSLFRKAACEACAQVCDRCAKVAETTAFEFQDQVVEQFRECAETCRQIAHLN
jgi:hypothetical protein